MAKLKTHSFIALIISAFLLLAACIAFAVGVSKYLETQGKTMDTVTPHLCTVANTTFNCYSYDDTNWCESTWYLECINPLDAINRNATIYHFNTQARLKYRMDTYTQNTSFIAFLYNDKNEAMWVPVDGAYATSLLSTTISCVIFLTIIMSISAAAVAHTTKNGCGGGYQGQSDASNTLNMGIPIPIILAAM
uniref:Uncharacterized protein n=1 Tax=Clandestinovirus TaxID=2831644 RepID=A0A8F8KM45_9VIRU|nr:hypothetical protein KOM_12_404 [Clandestinovirus]